MSVSVGTAGALRDLVAGAVASAAVAVVLIAEDAAGAPPSSAGPCEERITAIVGEASNAWNPPRTERGGGRSAVGETCLRCWG